MPDSDQTPGPPAPESEIRNLPVPVAPTNGAAPSLGSRLAHALRAVFRWKPSNVRADLRTMLEASPPDETDFSPEESTMLKNILGLRERRVEDVMVPRADIIAVQSDIPLGELMRVFEGAGHSRLVVFNDTLDDPVGMVHIRDLLTFITARAASPAKPSRRKKPLPAGLDFRAIDLSLTLSAAGIIRTLLFVPPSMPAIDLLAKMQATRIHLALVIDEYGGTDGIVSIEDIVELIVGDIADEHDEDEPPAIVRQADGSFFADARASLEDVVAIVGSEFEVGDVMDEVDTLGGYLATKVGRVPVRGELVAGPGLFEIEVLDADPRRVKKVRIYRAKDRRSRPREPRRRDENLPAVDAPATPAESVSREETSVLSSDPSKAARRP
jgi:CBS domain containing-hemolysin-like protein